MINTLFKLQIALALIKTHAAVMNISLNGEPLDEDTLWQVRYLMNKYKEPCEFINQRLRDTAMSITSAGESWLQEQENFLKQAGKNETLNC
ncbi:hypothetical protein LJB93_02040 [Desulfovibrio sp. OttesenSCG-928-F07]|nr:hypothetical protein [Desulfovibrio sp. OttesenSCG-928-F07]